MADDVMPQNAAEILTEAEAAGLLNMGRSTLERWRATGEGPPWVRLGRHRIRYTRTTLMAWIEARTYQHRAAELARKVAA